MNFRISEYAELEAEIGHRFRNDLSMAEIITATEQAATAEPTDETATIEFGQGQLWWPRFERQSDRYGTVCLLTGPDAEDYMSFENAPVGQPGRLVAVVVETRRSGHCGDIARSLAPTTPTVGEEITLGAARCAYRRWPRAGRPPGRRLFLKQLFALGWPGQFLDLFPCLRA